MSPEHGYLQHGRDWTITRDAIIRLTAKREDTFTYGDLAYEIERHDHLKIDPRGYAGALDAVAQHLGSSDPLWDAMVVNAGSGAPGVGFWSANFNDKRWSRAAQLSDAGRAAWLQEQRQWCVAAAKVIQTPLDLKLRDAEAEARDRARDCLIELLLAENRSNPG